MPPGSGMAGAEREGVSVVGESSLRARRFSPDLELQLRISLNTIRGMGLSPPLLPLLAWAALPGPGTLPFGPGASVGQEGRRAGPVEGAPVVRRLGAMGTWLEVEVRAAGRPAALAASEAAVRAIEAAEARLSTWREDTELARWNAEAGALEPRPLSAELADELGRALELADETGGAFDPACANLVEAYGLRGDGRWPEQRGERDVVSPGDVDERIQLRIRGTRRQREPNDLVEVLEGAIS